MSDYFVYIRYGIPIIICLGFFLIFLSLISYNKKVQKLIKERADRIKADFVLHRQNRYIQDFIPGSLAKWMDDTYKYSRFYTTKLGVIFNTSFKLFILIVISAFIFAIAIGFLVKEILWGFVSFLLFVTIAYLMLYIYRSYQNLMVTKDVSTFLNLLGNYSTANTEITSVFMQIAPKMHEPLSSALIECVAESENQNQTQIQALQNLSAKIENKKVREIVSSLIITKKYSGSFGDTVAAFRGSVLAYIRRANECRSLSIQNGISLGVVVGMLVASMLILGSLVEQPILQVLFHSTVGIVVTSIAAACILYFIKKIIEVMQ